MKHLRTYENNKSTDDIIINEINKFIEKSGLRRSEVQINPKKGFRFC